MPSVVHFTFILPLCGRTRLLYSQNSSGVPQGSGSWVLTGGQQDGVSVECPHPDLSEIQNFLEGERAH